MNLTSHLYSKATIVAIDYYGDLSELPPLEAPSKDAEAIASLLDQYGVDQKMFISRIPCEQKQDEQGKSEERVKGDELVKKDDLEKKIRELFDPPDHNPPDTAFFFFSGHGVCVPEEPEEKDFRDGNVKVYLATSDRNKQKGEHGIPISWLGEQIQKSKAKEVIVWLDCCYSGELLKYCPDDQDKRYCFITATSCYEKAYEKGYTGCEKGELTKVLIEGLTPKQGLNKQVNSHNLCEFVKNHQPKYGQLFQCKHSDAPIFLTTLKPPDYQNQCPYVALSAFQKDDADFFFGRSELINNLLDKLRNRKQERLVAILGASGSGKSSVMRAGLLHEIEKGQAIPGSNHWKIIEPFSPTDNSSEVLEKKLEVSHFHDFDQEQPIIIMVDQFEECFTMCAQKTRKAFVDGLMNLIDTHANLQIIIAMRDGFRGRLREFPDFSEQMSIVNVEPLNLKEIEEAIEKPAKRVGLTIEGLLKQQLCNDVYGYRGSLPLLQYTLTELWNKAHQKKERVLWLSVYKDLGGIEGTLQKRAEEVYDSLGPVRHIPLISLLFRSGLLNSSDSFGVTVLGFLLLLDYQKVARRIFLELTQIGETYDTRRRVKLGELENSYHSLDILDEVTNILASPENRLLTRSYDNTETSEKTLSSHQKDSENQADVVIDVVHEALIRHWPRLGNWKQKHRKAIMIARVIEDRARRYYKDKDDLFGGVGLEFANKYLKKSRELEMLDGIAERFIEESKQKYEEDRKKEDKRKAQLQNKTEQLEKRNQELQSSKLKLQKSKRKLKKNNVQLTKQTKRLQLAVMFASIALGIVSLLLFSVDKEKNMAEVREEVATLKYELTKPQDIKALIRTLGVVNTNLELNKNPVYILGKFASRKFSNSDVEIKLRPKVFARLIQGVENIPKRYTFTGHEKRVTSVAFSSDGKTIVSGSADGTIKLWDWDDDNKKTKALHTFKGHEKTVRSVAFSKDGKYIVSGSADGTIKLWDAKNPGTEALYTFTDHKQTITSVAFSKDGKYIVSGSDNGTINLWDAENWENWQEWVKDACGWLRLDPDFALPASETELKQEEQALEGAVKVCKDYGGWKTEEAEDFSARQKLAIARTKIEKVGQLATSHVDEDANSQLREVIKFIKKEKLDDEPQNDQVSLDAGSWNQLCRFGSIYGYAKDVLFACEKAVNNASAQDKTSWQDSRGLARALTGDRQGAIEDFQDYVDDESRDKKYTNKRKKWIEAMERGDKIDDIFTKEILKDLKTE
ncbi:MAG: caspase family protein [Crocosphaera sp.]